MDVITVFLSHLIPNSTLIVCFFLRFFKIWNVRYIEMASRGVSHCIVPKIEIHLWSTCLTNYCQDSHGLFQIVTVIKEKKNNHYLWFNFNIIFMWSLYFVIIIKLSMKKIRLKIFLFDIYSMWPKVLQHVKKIPV